MRLRSFTNGVAPFRILLLAALAVGLCACEKIQALCPPPPEVSPEPAGSAAAPAKEAAPEAPAPKPERPRGSEYMLPFAWEASEDEPLGRTRAFLAEALSTNVGYTERAGAAIAKLRGEQRPRATVVACSDSEVQSPAFDDSAEHDDYMVRTWGNRVTADPASVGHGVEQLESPLLLIVGHTGCSAIDRALDPASALPEPLRKELIGETPKDDAAAKLAPTEAVVRNVQRQVDAALTRFGARVQAGRLTIVGAVLDIENGLRSGAGRLVVVDVNGNRDKKRLDAFLAAVKGHEASDAASRASERLRPR